MEPIAVMVNGIPGRIASQVALRLAADPRFRLVPYALTGPDIAAAEQPIGAVRVRLVRPEAREAAIAEIRAAWPEVLCVDYTHPAAVVPNAAFYCRHGLPFVMGTTGGDRRALEALVAASPVAAVVAPNMARPIVGFQAMMEAAAERFPGLFRGFRLTIEESHQQGKADTSGTARALVAVFNRLGVPFREEEIRRVRDPEEQRNRLGVPEAYLGGHAWHTYRLVSEDETVCFEFTHRVNGRDVYVQGTLDALVFLRDRLREGACGRIFSMIDVLEGKPLKKSPPAAENTP